MELMIWNIILSFLSAIILWVVKSHADEVKRIQILLNRTREEIAKGGKAKEKKYASGGMAASKRADGIAQRGKTKCKMY